MIKKIKLASAVILQKIKNIIAPYFISDVKVEGKKAQFIKELELIKYKMEEIPLPRVTEHKEKPQKEKSDYAQEQSDLQQYYLYQFINIEKFAQKKRTKEFAKKSVVQFISILHFLSYKNIGFSRAGSTSVNLYKPNISSVTFNRDKDKSPSL